MRLEATSGGVNGRHGRVDAIGQSAPELGLHVRRIAIPIGATLIPGVPVPPDLPVVHRTHEPIQPAGVARIPVALCHRDVHERHREELLVVVGVTVRYDLMLVGLWAPGLHVEVPDAVGHADLQAALPEAERHKRRLEVLPPEVRPPTVGHITLDGVRRNRRVPWLPVRVLRIRLDLASRQLGQGRRHIRVFIDAEVQAPSRLVGSVVPLSGPPVLGIADIQDLTVRPMGEPVHRLNGLAVTARALLLPFGHLAEQLQDLLVRGHRRVVVRHLSEVVTAMQVPDELVALPEVARVRPAGLVVDHKVVGGGIEPFQVGVVQVAFVDRTLDEALGEHGVVALHRRPHPPGGVVRVDDEAEGGAARVHVTVLRETEEEGE